MKRGLSRVLSLTTALSLAAPFAVRAQTPSIGLLAWRSCSDEVAWFTPGLEELGYRAGQTITIECRSADQTYDGLALAAEELVTLDVDLIVSLSQPVGMAALAATDKIPIVSIISGDPVAAGIADSLARPGGNLTGLSYYANELTSKRIGLLLEMVPDLAQVDVLANPEVSYLPFEGDARREAARVGLDVRIHLAAVAADLDGTFAAMKADGADAVFILPDMMLGSESSRIAELALQHGLPTMAWGDWYTSSGCLMAYSADYGALIDRLASYADQVIRGADPAYLPIEQPTTFTLSINLHTAQALGVDVPKSLLLRADEIIE